MRKTFTLPLAATSLLGLAMLGPMTANERRAGRYLRDGGGHPGGGAPMTPEQLAKMVGDALDKVKKIADDGEKEIKRLGDLSGETKAKADEALLKFNVLDELKSRLDDLEQKGSRPGGGSGDQTKSYGNQLVESDEFKAFKERKSQGSMRLGLKAITTGTGSAGGLIVPTHETEIVNIPRRTDLVMRDLVTVMPIETLTVDYPKQTVRTNAAGNVAEGAAKPYSNYGWTRASTTVKTIAHLAKLTRQSVDDAPRLQAEVDSELRYGLALQEDAQILMGDGTGENLFGLYPQATAFSIPVGISNNTPNKIDKLRIALLQCSLGLFPADAMVLHEIDWADIEMTKDGQGRYVFANPTGIAAPTLWGKRVVPTQSITVGNFLVGAFKAAATLYDRMQVEVLISSENADDFEKNLLTMRAEERVALAVKRASALIKGPFANS